MSQSPVVEKGRRCMLGIVSKNRVGSVGGPEEPRGPTISYQPRSG